MKMVVKLIANNNEISEMSFDGRAFYNYIPVELAQKLELEKFPQECFESTAEAFEKRLNLTVSPKVLKKLQKNKQLDEEDKYLLEIISNKNPYYIEKYPQYFIGIVNHKSYGNLEDLRSFFEDNEDSLNDIDKILIEKVD